MSLAPWRKRLYEIIFQADTPIPPTTCSRLFARAGVRPGAANSPHSPVKITRLITRGFVSAKKSRQSAGIAFAVVAVIAL